MSIQIIACDSCDRPFEATRSDAQTCSITCRSRRRRERIAAEAFARALELTDLAQRQHDLFVRVSIDGFEPHEAAARALVEDLRRVRLASAT